MSAHHRSREQQSGLPGSSHRRSEREDRPRAGNRDHLYDKRDRRDQARSVGRERGTSHVARHSRDRTPTCHQSSDRRQHREQDRDPRQDTSGQRHAFHTELNSRGQQHAFHTESSSRGYTEPEQHDRYQARTDPSKSYQEQLQGQHRQYHERHRDRSSNRDRTAFRPDKGSERTGDVNNPPQIAAEGRRYQQHPQAAAYQSYPQARLHPPYPQAHQQLPQAQNGDDTRQLPNGPQAWPPQRQATPFRGGGNPFKGGGKWKHDLFEELTQPRDEAKPAAPVGISAAAAVANPVALASEADKSV
ncbi:TPA: hypothetical protein ACH3X3_004704 [Trebouxia sp. C0006]